MKHMSLKMLFMLDKLGDGTLTPFPRLVTFCPLNSFVMITNIL